MSDDLVKRLRTFKAVWGDLPSVAPHVKTAPGITTGMVIGATDEAADRIEALESQLADLRAKADALVEVASECHLYVEELRCGENLSEALDAYREGSDT